MPIPPRYLLRQQPDRQANIDVMTAILLDHLLRGTLPDPDSAEQLTVPTKSVVLAPSLDGAAPDLIGKLEVGNRLLVVSDPTTRRVLGERVASELRSSFAVEELVLGDDPHADLDTVAAIEAHQASARATALIAVGSGTINDVCKYAAHRQGLPYAVFATAPSMNGYTSVSAAITVDGHKKSLPATSALGVFADLGILAQAPARMIRSGFGDSICRSTAQADWLLAHLLLDQPYRHAPFTLLQEDEAALLARPADLLRGDVGTMELLMRNLILSGFGMTICGGSYPASQGEHLISHYLEMLPPDGWSPTFHGEQVAVATLTMARLQEAMLQKPAPVQQPSTLRASDLAVHFGSELGASCWKGFQGKLLDRDQAHRLTARLQRDWPMIRSAIDTIRRPAADLQRALSAAGAPIKASDIGLTVGQYGRAVLLAREIRDRFTFLDLAAESGQLVDFVAGGA
jgi:glycerol-1-phosphate dehydrogenase [NAD(P)+]